MNNKILPKMIAALLLVALSSISEGALDHAQLIRISDLLRSRDGEQVSQGRSLLLKADINNESLLALLDDTVMRDQEPEVVGASITLLGVMKATNAVDRIAGMLLYNEKTGRAYQLRDRYEDKYGRQLTEGVYCMIVCPAWKALREIGGEACIPAIASQILEWQWAGDQKRIAHMLALQALWKAEPTYEILYGRIVAHRDALHHESVEKLNEFIVFLEKKALHNLQQIPNTHDMHYGAQFDIIGILLRCGKHDEVNSILLEINRAYPTRKDLTEKLFRDLIGTYNSVGQLGADRVTPE